MVTVSDMRKKLPQATQKFRYPVLVTIGKTNAEGNVYWTHYLDWFAVAREVFLVSIFPDFLKLFSSGTAKIITHETNLKHIRDALLFDQMVIEIYVGEVGHTNAKVFFDFVREKDDEKVKIAEGWQVLVFADGQGKPTQIPPQLREAVLKYAAD